MLHALAFLISTSSPRALAQASPPPAAVACPTPRRFAQIAIDPLPPIDVNTTQHFVIAMRVVADGGFQWQELDADKSLGVRAEGSHVMSDVAFQNLDRKPSDPPATGGEATQLFLFTAVNPGTTTLTFGLFSPGGTTPTRTVSYTVRVSPNVAISC